MLHNALDKKDTKEFDEMFDIPRLYGSACSYSVQVVRLHPILMSILLYNLQELTKCIKEVEWMEAKVNKLEKVSRGLTKKEEKEEIHTTLDSFFATKKISEI